MQPLIIIGAPRSGTNILRDIVSSLPNIATWPCDEINYIWRYGNHSSDTDALTPDKMNSSIKRYINRQFESIAKKYKCDIVLEKTCANTVRIEYVNAVLPDAKYIEIVRDGRDAVASAMKRWAAPLDIPYILKKVQFVPLKDIPFYALKYAKNRIAKMVRPDQKRLSTWGPRTGKINHMAESGSLLELCACQWIECVTLSRNSLASTISPEKVYTIRYEEFVQKPLVTVSDALSFHGIFFDREIIGHSCSRVSKKSVGKWKSDIPGKDHARLKGLLADTLLKMGYQT